MHAMTIFLTRSIFLCLLISPALASPVRRALIIGNDTYPGNTLQNARNDARGVSESLDTMGYRVTLILDVDRVDMARAIETFANSIVAGDTVLVYYAGHGIQVAGENYLVPIDFQVSDEVDVKNQGYALSTVMEKLSLHGATTQIIILDACRNNPFLSSRGVSGGWASIGSSAGSFLAFGTSPGSTASDDPREAHGLFTKFLLQHLADPASDVEQMFQRVRTDVIRESNGRQVPWTASSLIGTFHIVPSSDVIVSAVNDLPIRASRNGIFLQTVQSPFEQARSIRNLTEDTSSQVVPNSNVTGDVLFRKAKEQVASHHFEEAIAILKEILSIDPRFAAAFRILGVVLHLSGRSVEADQALGKAIELNDRDAAAYSYRCLLKAGYDIPNSNLDCNKAISEDGTLASAHLGLAINLSALGRMEDAQQEATRAISLDPACAASLTFRGNVEFALGRSGLARQDYLLATTVALSHNE